jgi:hypothetical protein
MALLGEALFQPTNAPTPAYRRRSRPRGGRHHGAYEQPAAKKVEVCYPYFRVAAAHLAARAGNRATEGALLGPLAQVKEAIATAMGEMIVGSKSPADAPEEATETIQDHNRGVQ